MIAFDDEDSRAIRHAVNNQRVVILTPSTGATVSRAIIEVLANSSYSVVEESTPKPDASESKYNRQREWWNTPKKERRRKK